MGETLPSIFSATAGETMVPDDDVPMDSSLLVAFCDQLLTEFDTLDNRFSSACWRCFIPNERRWNRFIFSS